MKVDVVLNNGVEGSYCQPGQVISGQLTIYNQPLQRAPTVTATLQGASAGIPKHTPCAAGKLIRTCIGVVSASPRITLNTPQDTKTQLVR